MKLAEADQESEKTIHMLKSTNLFFYKAIWEAAKGSQALVTFHKRFYCGEQPTRRAKRSERSKAVLVDIVARDGTEWIKVSTVNEDRLLREIEKARWELAESSDEGSAEDEPDADAKKASSLKLDSSPLQDEYDRMDLVRSTADLIEASRSNRLHYESPRVRLVLPKISVSPPEQLSPLFDRLRAKGVLIDYTTTPTTGIEDLNSHVFPNLLPSPHPLMTSTVNIDCTILLALVSDLSYAEDHPVHPSFNEAIRRQIELEKQDHLLPLSLWPALAGKELVCTAEAEIRMREIVDTIGTPSERIRTDLIMGSRPSPAADGQTLMTPAADPSDLRARLQQHSDFPVPDTFRIPIAIKHAPSDEEISSEIEKGILPAIATQVAADLTPINKSVFMFGWVHGCTTASSNRAVVKAMERMIEKHEPGWKGPEVWLREPARSLIGKEKERVK